MDPSIPDVWGNMTPQDNFHSPFKNLFNYSNEGENIKTIAHLGLAGIFQLTKQHTERQRNILIRYIPHIISS